MRGGYRKGAGRKKGFSAIEAEKAREYFAGRVSASLEPIVDALIRKAKKGDTRAFAALMDRAFGRPAQESNVTVRETIPYDDLPTPITELSIRWQSADESRLANDKNVNS